MLHFATACSRRHQLLVLKSCWLLRQQCAYCDAAAACTILTGGCHVLCMFCTCRYNTNDLGVQVGGTRSSCVNLT